MCMQPTAKIAILKPRNIGFDKEHPMKMNLTEVEIRILGCLVEKELTTP